MSCFGFFVNIVLLAPIVMACVDMVYVCLMQKEISRLLVALDDFHTRFYPMVFLLHRLVHGLPTSPLGKQVRVSCY